MKRQQLLTAKVLYQLVCENPGLSYDQLANRSTYAANTCRTLCVDMVERGLVYLQKDSPRDLAGKAIGRLVTCVFPVTETKEYAEFQETRRVASIAPQADHSAELEELRAFKERALAEFPELGIDPRTRKARKILAKYVDDPKERQEILNGDHDETGSMKAVLELMPA